VVGFPPIHLQIKITWDNQSSIPSKGNKSKKWSNHVKPLEHQSPQSLNHQTVAVKNKDTIIYIYSKKKHNSQSEQDKPSNVSLTGWEIPELKCAFQW
jgi:hypothetical protein